MCGCNYECLLHDCVYPVGSLTQQSSHPPIPYLLMWKTNVCKLNNQVKENRPSLKPHGTKLFIFTRSFDPVGYCIIGDSESQFKEWTMKCSSLLVSLYSNSALVKRLQVIEVAGKCSSKLYVSLSLFSSSNHISYLLPALVPNQVYRPSLGKYAMSKDLCTQSIGA